MKASLFTKGRRLFGSTGQALWRNKWGSLFAIGGLSLVFLFVFLGALIGLLSNKSIDYVYEKVNFSVFMQPHASDFEIGLFENALKEHSEDIASYEKVSKQENYRRALEERNISDRIFYIEGAERLYEEFYATFTITPTPSLSSMENIKEIVLSEQFHDIVDQETFKANEIDFRDTESFLKLVFNTQNIIPFVVIFFLIIGFFIAFHNISLLFSTRKREMFIMRLVGAQLFSIRLPFLLEAIALTFFALTLSGTLFYWISKILEENISLYLEENYDEYLQIQTEDIKNIIITYGIILLASSLIASYIATERALRKQSLVDV